MPQRSLSGTKSRQTRAHASKPRVARPITSKRDYEQAADVVRALQTQSRRESQAELRLQQLIHEMEKYDNDFDDFDDFEADFTYEAECTGLSRRWSDDPNDLD
jgi:hypothetical protein